MTQELGKILLLVGVVFVVLGLVLTLGGKFFLGHLPGDIVIRKKGVVIFLPIATSIILSLILTLVLNLLLRR